MTIEALIYHAIPNINNEIEPDIENTCRARLNEINNNEETSYLFDDVYGNDDGRTILERLANMEKEIKSLRQKSESLQQSNKSLRQKSESYEAELGSYLEAPHRRWRVNRDDC
jgi:dsDNA-specific endonuclease/ATPase MutS2